MLSDADAIYVGGAEADKLYLGAHRVWQAIIRVTPTAPTFHDGEPWYTLPQQEGVTYTVDGMPGWEATVIVFAHPEVGYQLDGQTEWEHTYGPPPRYSASDSGGGGSVGSNSWTTVTSHTVTSEGMAGGTWWFQWNVTAAINRTYSIRVRRNGQIIASETTSPSSGSQVQQTANIPDTALTAGDHLTFEAHLDTSNSYHRTYTAWSWSLS